MEKQEVVNQDAKTNMDVNQRPIVLNISQMTFVVVGNEMTDEMKKALEAEIYSMLERVRKAAKK